MALEKIVPACDWIQSYRRADLRSDLSSALIVAVMLVPQGMAYALLAGLPPVYGLYASIVPTVVYAALVMLAKVAPRVPASMAVVAAAALIVYPFDLEQRGSMWLERFPGVFRASRCRLWIPSWCGPSCRRP